MELKQPNAKGFACVISLVLSLLSVPGGVGDTTVATLQMETEAFLDELVYQRRELSWISVIQGVSAHALLLWTLNKNKE